MTKEEALRHIRCVQETGELCPEQDFLPPERFPPEDTGYTTSIPGLAVGLSDSPMTPGLTNTAAPTTLNPWLMGFIGLGIGLTAGLMLGLANGDKRERRAGAR